MWCGPAVWAPRPRPQPQQLWLGQLSCSSAYEISLPGQGIESVPPALASNSFPLSHQGSTILMVLKTLRGHLSVIEKFFKPLEQSVSPGFCLHWWILPNLFSQEKILGCLGNDMSKFSTSVKLCRLTLLKSSIGNFHSASCNTSFQLHSLKYQQMHKLR